MMIPFVRGICASLFVLMSVRVEWAAFAVLPFLCPLHFSPRKYYSSKFPLYGWNPAGSGFAVFYDKQ